MATLTTRQTLFIAAYTGNATQAAIEAGFSARSARQHAARLMANAAIQAAMAARQAQDSQRLQISRQDVIQGLLDAFAMAKEQANPAAMVSAARELGRLMGFYAAERHAVEVSAVADAEMGRLEKLCDAELLRLIAAS